MENSLSEFAMQEGSAKMRFDHISCTRFMSYFAMLVSRENVGKKEGCSVLCFSYLIIKRGRDIENEIT